MILPKYWKTKPFKQKKSGISAHCMVNPRPFKSFFIGILKISKLLLKINCQTSKFLDTLLEKNIL